MRDFNQINTCGLDLKDAMQVAVDSETSRDFEPTIEGVTVGLSSGTSGNRGLFLASSSERAIWVAAVLQRIGVRAIRQGGTFVQEVGYRWSDWVGPPWTRPSRGAIFRDALVGGWGMFEHIDMCSALGAME